MSTSPTVRFVVCVEAGAEKLRYITGKAIALRALPDGPQKITIALDDIFDLARAEWGERPSVAEC